MRSTFWKLMRKLKFKDMEAAGKNYLPIRITWKY
jgi:hypothetical protein